MDSFFIRVYAREITTQCEFALYAVNNLNASLQRLQHQELSAEERHFFHSEVFRQTHSFLTHASNISRMFWPPLPVQKKNESDEEYENRLLRNDKAIRSRTLKNEYGIEENNPLKNRKLRDHLEHYDERLDHWRNNSTHRNIASDTIGPRNSISGLQETDMMRWFDPTRNFFQFRGEEYNLQEIATAVDLLLPISQAIEENAWGRMTGRNA